MKKRLLLYFFILIFYFSNKLLSQTYQLTGNPINTTGWTIVPSTIVSGDFVRLVDDITNASGAIKLNAPINLKYCDKWRVEFDFRIDGNGTSSYGKGDGFAFWYLANPPITSQQGSGLGIPQNAVGLMVGFDIYNNSNDSAMSKVHLAYGVVQNTNNTNNIEFFNTPGSSFHSADLNSTQPFVGSTYKRVEVTGQIDPAIPANWIITVRINGNIITSQSFAPSGGAATMTQGYFGFSASTGAASARSSIKNVKIYADKVPVQQSTITKSFCPGNNTVDLTSFNAQLTSNPNNYNFTYYIQGSSTPIVNPTNFQFNSNTTVVVYIRDSAQLLCDNSDSKIQLNITPAPAPTITASSSIICYGGNITLTSNQPTGNAWSTGETTPSITITAPGTYTLTNNSTGCTSIPASITITGETDPDLQITGNLILCESSSQLIASSTGNGNIYTWSNGTNGNTTSVSTPGTYAVTVKTPAGCEYQKSVTVTQGVVPVVQNSSLSQCSNSPSATFDLTSAQNNLSTTPGVSFDYYVSQADALAGNTNIIPNPTAYVSGNATIYVRIRSATCSKVAELQLIISATATPTITASTATICYGGSITLTSNQPTGNAWSTGETTPSIIITAPGTYTLTNNSTGCTSIPASITITGETDPDLQITGNLILCESSSQLIASSTGNGNIYTWSNGTNGNTTSVSTPGTYVVTVKTPAGCEYQKSVTVTQGVVPVIQNSSLSQCSNSPSATFDLTSAQNNLSTTPGVSFDYYVSQADALAGNTNIIPNPTAYVSGNATIYVRIKSTTCSKVAELQLIINLKPVPVITASANAICNGTGVTLTSNLPTGNIWSTGATTPSITVNTAGTYTLTNSNGTCTSDSTSITILSGTDPNLQITGATTFCQGTSTVLTATATGSGNTFLWSNGINTASNTITTPGNYTVTVTTAAGCQYQKSVIITMDPAIVINIATPGEITCTTSQITLDATASVYQPGATFLWTATGGGNIVSGGNTLTPIVNNGGVYTLRITSATPFGCIQQSSVTVIKNITLPTVILSSPKLTICKGESVTITASGATTYSWTPLSGSGNIQTVSPVITTTYSVTGTSTNGCKATANITINVVPEITSTLHDVEICPGDRAILDAGSGPNYTYIWNTGATTQTISVTNTGTYTVTINNGFCSKTFSATVSNIPTPQILQILYKDPALTVIAKNNGNTPLEYSIDGEITWQSSNIFTPVLRNTKYTISVRNKGTTCSSNTEYYTFFMANIITPNDDGINDILDFSIISKYGNFEGGIFDRYGKSVFKISSKNPIWNGKYLGRPLPTDTYWYKLSWENRLTKKLEELSGWVLLKNRE